MGFQTELSNDELGMIATALKIQRERWHDIVMRKVVGDDSDLAHVDLGAAQKMEQAHEALLARLPDRGLNF